MTADVDGEEPRGLRVGDPFPPEHDRTALPLQGHLVAELYRDHSARLRRFFRWRASASDAEDLVQETFARLAGATARASSVIEQPRAYVNRIADNLVREQARFAARRSAALHLSDDEVQLAGADPIAALETRDMLARLEAAMARMKPLTREIFMAHRLDGYTYREISERTGHSIKSVERHIGKAIILVNRAMRGR